MTTGWLDGRRLALAGMCAGLSLVACGGDGFPTRRQVTRLVVAIDGADRGVTGTRQQPLKLTIGSAQPFRITVRAEDASGQPDPSFNGWVRISSKPGSIERLSGPDTDGRSLKLTAGVSPEVEVRLFNAYGATYLLADDLGYSPTDPTAEQLPGCANGVDDDGDGTIDLPADEGCAFANDATETGGSFAQGASTPIFYELPRIADIRGVTCKDGTCSTTGRTPYPKEQVQIDTGYREREGGNPYDFDLIVTRISTGGFFVSDIRDRRSGFNSVFAFNFNAPPRMRLCDRLRTFSGTIDEFFGQSQLGYPTWTLEEWNPKTRPCSIPEPTPLNPAQFPSSESPGSLLPLTSSLVRVITITDKVEVKVTPKFGPDNVPEGGGGQFLPQPNATNCDFDKNGRIERSSGNPEGRCASACTADPECSEYSAFAGGGTFRLTVTDLVERTIGAIQADASTSSEFKPLERRGQVIKSFSGTLAYFSGGNQFTIEARCKDDIVVDPKAEPVPSDKACIGERSDLEEAPQ